jgi:hypothetical protein
MINETLYSQFLMQIEMELSMCDGNVTPLICYNYSNASLKKELIRTIAETCISQKIGIASAIVEVERLYSVNSLD